MKKLILIIILVFAPKLYASTFETDLVSAALKRTEQTIRYDGAYVSIKYPNGDIPSNTGVCTDVIIRTYRALEIDLQQLVHEDIKEHFALYPSNKIWGLNKPDKNIDHRRVPNLQVFFERHGVKLAITVNPKDYQAGDLVTWLLPGNLPHIGIVINEKNAVTDNPMIVHNIGRGPEASDMLFKYKITGHYRFKPTGL
jgi:uncharacterized protein YijF (DUF1287 family)